MLDREHLLQYLRDSRPRHGGLAVLTSLSITICTTVLVGATTFAAPPAHARAITHNLDIPAQDLGAALKALGAAANEQLLFSDDVVAGLNSHQVKGEYSTDEAIALLLKGSRLKADRTPSGVLLIRSIDASPSSSLLQGGDSPNTSGTPDPGTANEPNQKGFWSRLRIAQAENPSPQGRETQGEGSQPSDEKGDPRSSRIEEIIVTAQKREERLQDVPVPVTVISAESLATTSQLRIQDYYTRVPGLNLTMLGDIGQASLSIRGLTTGGNVLPTVGIVVDDIPFGPSIYVGGGSLAPDFDPSELSQVEVLRGPQGTLYGANSLGGLLKFSTVAPQLNETTGRVQLGTTSVHGSDELGYAVRAAANLPLTDALAVRLSGSTRRDPGYIDNLQTEEEDVNTIESSSGRLAALWQPTDNYSLLVSALAQKTDQDGTADTHLPNPLGPRPDLGDLEQSTLINSGKFHQRMQAFSATFKANVGGAQFTSLSGYNVKETFNALDTPLASLATASQTRFGVRGFVTEADVEVSKFSQEFRLVMPLTERIEWLLGAFYTDESADGHANWLAIDQNTGDIAGTWLVVDSSSSYEEYTAFTDFTFQLSDRLDVQVGGRATHNRIATGGATTSGPYNTVILRGPSETSVTPEFRSEDSPLNYLLTPRFRVTPDVMVYARFASGYRPGGPNTSPTVIAAGLPSSYEADTARAYEIGAKGAMFDDALYLDASVYYIDWRDVQLQVRDPITPTLQYTVNGGEARSEGIELSAEVRPISGMTIAASGAYNNAELTAVPSGSSLNAHAGDRLPYSARRSGSLAIDQEFPLWGEVTGSVGATMSYVGDRKGRYFTGTVTQGTFPSYEQIDLRASLDYETWSVHAFVNNVSDERGVLRGGRDASLSLQYIVTYTQPRTAGLSFTKTF